jgi:DNA processing protein
VSTERGACDACLRRAWLVASLSGHIETAVNDSPGSRASELLGLPDRELAVALARSEARSALDEAADRDPEALWKGISDARSWAICRHDASYPAAVLDCGKEAPAVLFGRGDRLLLGELSADRAVTIVGARRPSMYGRDMGTAIAQETGAAGLAVVSGMALGIDSCAHRGALNAGGLTVAVLGGGPDVPHPARMRRLYQEIVERGLVLSELPPGTPPRRWTFPARNRIMAALGAMTVVVEARERSGSLITAGMASDLGREVGAVPGQVGTSSAAGVNSLLRDGAHVIRNGQDVLDSLLGVGILDRRRVTEALRGSALDEDLRSVLDMVELGATGADAVASAFDISAGEAASALTRLELAGYLKRDSSGCYQRSRMAQPDAD